MIKVTQYRSKQSLDGEASAQILYRTEEGSLQGVVIHPWSRKYGEDVDSVDSSVFIEVGYFDPDGTPAWDEDKNREASETFIADREDFVEALLAVFPELKRADVES